LPQPDSFNVLVYRFYKKKTPKGLRRLYSCPYILCNLKTSNFLRTDMKSFKQFALSLFIGAAFAAAVVPETHAQGTQQPYKILVGFAPGGTLDTIARILAERVREPLGQSVIVDNKPGAGGRIAIDILKTMPADGSVAMMCPDFISTIYPLVYQKLNYDPDLDLVVASTVAESAMALAVPAASTSKTLAQYADWIRANPNQANFGHGALGGPTYLLGLMIGKEIGVPMTDVPFSGGAAMMPGLVGNQFSSGTSYIGDLVEYHKGGRVRILAISASQRSPLVPEVPTFTELGYKNLIASSIFSLCLPRNTPTAVLQKWSAAVATALGDKQVRDKIAALNFTPQASTPAEAQQRNRALRAFWEPTVKASGFKAD
jgi:tripartite-type tricarboxylate transporter receptor subunit TctC